MPAFSIQYIAKPIIPVRLCRIGRGTKSSAFGGGSFKLPLAVVDETSKADVFIPAFEGGGTTFPFDDICKNPASV